MSDEECGRKATRFGCITKMQSKTIAKKQYTNQLYSLKKVLSPRTC